MTSQRASAAYCLLNCSILAGRRPRPRALSRASVERESVAGLEGASIIQVKHSMTLLIDSENDSRRQAWRAKGRSRASSNSSASRLRLPRRPPPGPSSSS